MSINYLLVIHPASRVKMEETIALIISHTSIIITEFIKKEIIFWEVSCSQLHFDLCPSRVLCHYIVNVQAVAFKRFIIETIAD